MQPEPDSDDSTPHPSGRPSWVRMPDGEFQLFFTWGRVFEDIQKNKKVRLHEGDQTALKRRMLSATGESEFRIERVRVETGVRRRYVVWTQDHITHLNNIAHPDGQPDQKTLIIKGQIEFQNPIIGSGKLVCGPA